MTTTVPALKLHWMNASRSTRILWLLNELNIPFDLQAYYRIKGRSPPEVLNIHPLGKIPILEDKRNGIDNIIAESGHITNYLIKYYDVHGNFEVTEEEADQVDYYTQLEGGSLTPPLISVLLFNIMESRTPWFLRPLVRLFNTPLKTYFFTPEVFKVLDFLEGKLSAVAFRVGESGEIYLVGDKFTGAEIMLLWPVNFMILQSDGWKGVFDPAKYPSLIRWVEQLKRRPAYQKTIETEKVLNAKNPANSAF